VQLERSLPQVGDDLVEAQAAAGALLDDLLGVAARALGRGQLGIEEIGPDGEAEVARLERDEVRAQRPHRLDCG
jgi:hypothetical protein